MKTPIRITLENVKKSGMLLSKARVLEEVIYFTWHEAQLFSVPIA